MRFFPKFITPRKKTKKHVIQSSRDGSITSDDDNSSISSSSSTNNNNNSSSTPKLHRRHNFPILSTQCHSSTTQHQLRALPIHIQFAFGMFMKRPIDENWVYLVSLLRGEKLRQLEMGGGGGGGGRVEKSLADELTVFEAEEVDEEEEEKDSTIKHDEEKHQSNNNDIGSTTPTSSEIDIPETVAKTFIKRPSAGNWDLLVELFRNEKRQQQHAAVSSNLLRKDQPHQVLRVESDLTFDEEHNDDDTKTLSIILEEEDEDGESRNPAEEGVVEAHCEAYDSDDEEEELLAEEEEEETNPSTTTTKEEQSPFAEHELDWPWPGEGEAVLPPIVAAAAAAASEEEEAEEKEEEAAQIMTEAAPTTLPTTKKSSSSSSSSPRIPPGFANTKAKAYVLLWEKRCRRFDQSQVNVVQKSSLAPNNDDNNNNAVATDEIVEVNSRKKNDDVSPPLATTTSTTTTRNNKPAEGRDDEIIQQYQYYYEENKSGLLSNDVITHRTQSPAVVEEVTNSVRDEVNYWENKMRNIHKDASYVLGR